MKTISDRITAIKKELDSLEEHVNSTLSILDCKKLELNKYDESYSKFEWKTYSYYLNDFSVRMPEKDILDTISKYKDNFDIIHKENLIIMEKNKETLNKICNFLVQLGFSMTTYTYRGNGRNRRSFEVDSEWVSHLKTQYKIADEKYDKFIVWYEKNKNDVTQYFHQKRLKEENERIEREKKEAAANEQKKLAEENHKIVMFAVDYLISNGKVQGKDFCYENAVEKANELRELLKLLKVNPKENLEIKMPKIDNALERMEI